MSLNKLLYFCYEEYLHRTGLKLTSAKVEAWDHGPVFREIYRDFKQYGSENITGRAKRFNATLNILEVAEPEIAPPDASFLAAVVDPLMRLPAFILREVSHAHGGAWDKVWNHTTSSNPGMEITDDLILNSHVTARMAQ
jgi:uncharacterized phage-associated protein